MGALERVMQMKQQGGTNSQIIDTLRKEGVPPKDINDAITQLDIKNSVNSDPAPQQPANETSISEIPNQTMPESQMHRSMMQQENQRPQPEPQIQQGQMSPPQMPPEQMQQIPSSFQPSTVPAPDNFQGHDYPPPAAAEYSYPSDSYNERGYSQYSQYPEYQEGDVGGIDTISEIAEQIVDERISLIKKDVSRFAKFREEVVLDVERLNERLTKIENNLNELQSAILGKIGEYGRNIQDISKEVHATQNSFAKVINPLTDNVRALQKIAETKKINKPKPNIRTTPDHKSKTPL